MGIAQIAWMASGAAWAQQAAATPDSSVVVITGQRAALESAQKIKQEADEIVDSIVAEDIGKLPDRSITEVLSRVVGVTLDRSMPGDPQHSAVEGSGINIRGLTYVRSELNGRESFSANGGRSLSFADVPPELMAGVDVYKNPSAEQTEGGISGLVNLRTAMPFDSKGFKGSATYQSSYSTLRKGKMTPSASVLLSNRWTTPLGEFGALIDLASSESHTRTDSLALDAYYPRDDLGAGRKWLPRTAQWRSMNWERDRKGAYAALQWRPFRDLTASLTYFKSKYDEGWSERVLLPSFGDGDPHRMEVTNAQYDSNGVFQSGTMNLRDTSGNRTGLPFAAERRVSERNSSTTDVNLNVQWRVAPMWTVRTDLQQVKASTRGFDSTVADGFMLPSQTLDLTGEYPRLSFTDTDREFLANPSNYYWVHMMEHMDQSKADAKAWRADVKYDFDHPVLRDLRFGVRLTDRESLNQNTVPSYNWSAITPAWMRGWRIPGGANGSAMLTDPRFPLGKETSPYSFPSFFGGEVSVPTTIFPNDSVAMNYPGSYNELHSYYMQRCRDQSPTGDCPRVFNQAGWLTDPAGDNRQSEQTKALYTQLRFGWDQLRFPIDGNIGLRYVKTESTAHGYTVYRPTAVSYPADRTVVGLDKIPDIAPISDRQDFENAYSNLLPSLNLRLKASEKLQFRFAVAKSMSRPSFTELQANTTLTRNINATTVESTNTTTINSVTLSGTGTGNPMLRPTTATSFDLTAEWYFRKGSSLTAAVFHKKLKDIVVSQNFAFQAQDRAGNPHTFLATGPTNGANGFAKGFEVAFQHYFDNMPRLLKGLGTQASFTFVDSERRLKNPVFSQWCSGAQSAQNFNIAINGCDTDGRAFGNLPLVGLSRRTINLAVMYDNGPISARLAYNWRSRYLQGVNNFGTRGADARDTNPSSPTFGQTNLAWGLPLWSKAYGQLDGSVFYNVTPKLRVGLEAQNLNDAKSVQQQQQHIGMMGRAWFVTGPRYTLQAHYSF